MARIGLLDLELLATVADAGSFTRGAERMHVTLASASERIRRLESRLGVPLFERRPRGVVPTVAGRIVLGHAREILGRVEALQSDLARLRQGKGGRLRLWSNTAAMVEWVPPRLATFLHAHPGVEVELVEHASADIVAALRRGRCDIGVVSDAVDHHELQAIPVRADPLDLVLPRAHPLAARRTLSLQALTGEAWVGLSPQAPLQRWIDEHVRADGHRLAHRLRVGTLDEACRMVASGIGVAIVPRATAVRRRRDGLARAALREAWARRGLQVCVRDPDRLGAAATALLQALTR